VWLGCSVCAVYLSAVWVLCGLSTPRVLSDLSTACVLQVCSLSAAECFGCSMCADVVDADGDSGDAGNQCW
jgi:hypothetical protein